MKNSKIHLKMQSTVYMHFAFYPSPHKMFYGITVQITGSSRDILKVSEKYCLQSSNLIINLSTIYRDKTQEKKD